jgi:hypothetical protein
LLLGRALCCWEEPCRSSFTKHRSKSKILDCEYVVILCEAVLFAVLLKTAQGSRLSVTGEFAVRVTG